MRITVTTGEITSIQTPALVVNLFQGVTEPGGATGTVDKALDGAISRLIREGEIKGAQGAVSMLHTLGKISPDRVVVVGLGPPEKLDAQVVRQVSGDVVRYLRQRGISRAATIAPRHWRRGGGPRYIGTGHFRGRPAGALPFRVLSLFQR